MIVDTNVNIKLNARNINRLRGLNYSGKLNDFIEISIEHLSNGSKCKINVECDICSSKHIVMYSNYNKQIISDGLYYCMCCRHIKINKTCLEKYGTEMASQSSSVKDKMKKTNIERYGVENPYQSEMIKDKIKKTNLERYGVEHPSQNEDIFLKTQRSRFQSKKYKTHDLFYRGII